MAHYLLKTFDIFEKLKICIYTPFRNRMMPVFPLCLANVPASNKAPLVHNMYVFLKSGINSFCYAATDSL